MRVRGFGWWVLGVAACSGESGATRIGVVDATVDAPPTPDDVPPETAAAVTFHALWTRVLAPNCALSACHGSGAGLTTMNDEEGAFTALVGRESSNCLGFSKVEPRAPFRSSLYLKVREDYKGRCDPSGLRMPKNAPPLSDTDIAFIRAWIDGGALR